MSRDDSRLAGSEGPPADPAPWLVGGAAVEGGDMYRACMIGLSMLMTGDASVGVGESPRGVGSESPSDGGLASATMTSLFEGL